MPRGRKKKTEKVVEEKNEADEVKAYLNKMLGGGAVQILNTVGGTKVESIPTGSLALDHKVIASGGIPRGRITEIYGPEQGGKTTLCLHLIAHALQPEDALAAFIDAEHSLNPEYCESLGIDLSRMMFIQPDSGEDAFEAVEEMCKTGKISLIVIDSVAALTPRQELEADVGQVRPGAQARMMSQNLRRLTSLINQSNTAVVFINQLRHKIGGYGNPETTAGGNALKFYSSLRLDVRKIGAIKKGDEQTGNRVRIKCVKNKMAPPFKYVELDLIFGEGISTRAELVDFGVACKVILKSGSWYSIDVDGEVTKIGQGRDKVLDFLDAHPVLVEHVREKVKEYLCAK
mgnify:CR=1 FL=1